MQRFGTGKKTWLAMVLLIFILALSLDSVLAAPQKSDKKAAEKDAVTAATGMRFENFPDMSDFDPSNPVIPTGDTIKIAIVASFSGPAAITGQLYFISTQWAAHAINKKGGILVDGKKKLVEVIKADHMGNPAACKKVVERMALQEKVDFLIGSDGSRYQKILNATAGEYKIIAVSAFASSDDMQDATNFNRNAFQTSFSTEQTGRAMAYFYGQIRKKEKKFYILNQDYAFGRDLAEGFKKGLKEYFPEAQLVGEDYHKIFLTDYAPYLTKIKASGAEVIFTGDWAPDSSNLLKQARQMGVKLPFANIYVDEPNALGEIGIEGTKGLINITQYGSENPTFKTEAQKKYYQMWHKLWETKWKAPYNTTLYQYPWNSIASWTEQVLWLLSIVERAGTTNAGKIIPLWEGDTYKFMNGKILTMRACDHKAIQDLHIYEFVPPEEQKQSMNMPPYYWTKDSSNRGPAYKIPAAKILPWMDQKLDRCKGKNDWGK